MFINRLEVHNNTMVKRNILGTHTLHINCHVKMYRFTNLYKTRCTRGDARSFSVLTKRICMHKTNFLRIYSNIVLKVILICKLQLS